MFQNNILLNGKKAHQTKARGLMNGSKGQGMIIDLIMLILIASLFFIIMSAQIPHQAPDAGVIRSKSMQTQRILIALLDARAYNATTFENATVAELISEKYYGKATVSDLNKTVQEAMHHFNKPNHYFILFTEDNKIGICSPEIESLLGKCCVKTDKITVAKTELNLPGKGTTTVGIGIWPKDMEVEACD